MLPRKLVEIAFRRLLVLLVPVIAVPGLVVLLQDHPSEYRASAVVWIADPPGGRPAIGHYNSYLSPSQNQVNSLNDLLTTESFRDAIALEAGLPALLGDTKPTLPRGMVSAYSAGVNLLVITATASTPEQAPAVVNAVISQFNSRAASETEREASISDQFYRQQLAVAERELETRRKAVDEYLRAHPAAATPGSVASLDFDYQTLVSQAEEQRQVVAELSSSVQDVQLKRVAAPQNQEAAFSVQDEPEAPTGSIPMSATQRLGYPVAGLLLGVFLAGCYLYIVYRTDHTVLSSEDLEGLNVQLLGRVPDIRRRSALGNLPGVGRLSRSHRDFARHAASAISTEARQQA